MGLTRIGALTDIFIARTAPCCDLCLSRKKASPDAILTDQEEDLLTLLNRIQSRTKPLQEQEVIDVDVQDLDTLLPVSQVTSKKPGSCRKDRLKLCRDALE